MDSPSYRWALRCIVVQALFSLILFGDATANMNFGAGLPDLVSNGLLATGLVLEVFCLIRLYLALGEEPGLDDAQKKRLRVYILLAGPLGAIQAWLDLRRLAKGRA